MSGMCVSSYRFSAYSDLVRDKVVLTDHLFAGALEGVDGVAVSSHLRFKSLMLLDLTLNYHYNDQNFQFKLAILYFNIFKSKDQCPNMGVLLEQLHSNS